MSTSLWGLGRGQRAAWLDAQVWPPFDFQIRLRCQKGIPPSLRGRAWQFLSGGKVKLQQNPGKFDVSCPSFPCPPFLVSGHLLGGGDLCAQGTSSLQSRLPGLVSL